MPSKPVRKGFDILEAAEEIRGSKQPPRYKTRSFDLIESRLIDALREQLHIGSKKYLASAIWSDLLLKTRNYPKPEFRDEISELRQEVDALKVMVRSLTKNLESSKLIIDELSRQVRGKHPIRLKEQTHLDELCNTYIKMVSKIKILKKIYIVANDSDFQCWTIIDAEPFNSAVRKPIYEAQIKIYQEMQENLALDFHVLNLSELADRQELESILPPSAKLVWQR